MAKRRTRKQKQKANERYTFSWTPSTDTVLDTNSVKGKKETTIRKTTTQNSSKKMPISTEEQVQLRTIKIDVVKSVTVAFIFVSLEVMLYFIQDMLPL